MKLRVQAWRERRGWSLRKLGERSGVAYPNIQRIETGTLSPTVTTLVRLARALGVGVRDLFPATKRRAGRRAKKRR
jgi:transcriptional regulator with XRE-family HTH domain